MRPIAALFFLLATPALATEWVMRPGDVPLTSEALRAALVGRTLTFHDDATSVYLPDGRYSYTYGGGGTWHGEYALGEDGSVCVTFVTGVSRCDLYVMNANRLILITADGLRFPVRP